GLCHANLLVSAPTAATCCVSAVFIPFISDDTAPTDIYTLSLHDALPILVYMELSQEVSKPGERDPVSGNVAINKRKVETQVAVRSEEHTSELQSRENLVCRLLLEKKKKQRS